MANRSIELKVAKISSNSVTHADIMDEYGLFDEILLDGITLMSYYWQFDVTHDGVVGINYTEKARSVETPSMRTIIEIYPLHIDIVFFSHFYRVQNNKYNMSTIKEWQNLNS